MHKVAQLMANIHEKWPNLTPVLTGAPNEKHLVDEIRRNLPASIPFIDKVGDSTLPELFSIIRDARFVVTNDTGTAHLSPLFSVPTVVILGGGHIGAYLPNPLYTKMQCVTHPMDCFNCGWNCNRQLDGANLCIASVNVDDVMTAIEKIM